MTAKYLYGIIRDAGTSHFGPIGIPSGEAEVYVVEQDGIAGVVSDYQGPQLNELPRHELLRQLTLHQRVLETVMQEHTVLPAKFGTVLPSRTELRRAMRCAGHQLVEALEKFDGLVQYEVAATWELGIVFNEIANEEDIASLRVAASGKPPADALELRIRIGAMIKESLDRRREGLRRQLTSLVAEYAIDHQTNVLMGDEMVMNVAFLVPRLAQGAFLDNLHQVDARFDGKLNVRCIGPLPPYSFSTIEIVRPDPQSVDAALQLLGLSQRISISEVRRAYREQAAKLHPDVNRAPEARDLFARLRDAEALLVACCLGNRDRGRSREDGSHGVTRDEVDRTYLVAVTRAGS